MPKNGGPGKDDILAGRQDAYLVGILLKSVRRYQPKGLLFDDILQGEHCDSYKCRISLDTSHGGKISTVLI